MKKNHFTDRPWSGIKKLLIIMKLTAVLLFLSGMAIAAGTYGQVTRFDLNVKDVTIIQLFDEIEHVTEFGFLFKTDQLDLTRQYTLDLKKANIDQILNEVLDKNLYNYTVIDRNIVITKIDAYQDTKTKKVTGKVTDSSGATLPGVSVVLKGTTLGVITDLDGKFAISSVPENATLQFSFVGMKSLEIAVGNKSIINVSLSEETFGHEEVVAIGYGTQSRRVVTGAISRVDVKKMETLPITNIGQSLRGNVAGVQYLENGRPGQEGTILIRGQRSISASNSPLIVLDGIIFEGNINDINPGDIDALDILKDASATAIYGARAANGVILVTSKKGITEKPTIRFSGYYGKIGRAHV